MEIAKKYCEHCLKKRSLLDRLFPLDYAICEKCHFQLINEIRNKQVNTNNDKEK